ncbi:hypothetical protein Pres01_11710 [Metapseudomonas resinovorans]|nr:hypothetical protein Pres01_11710 [Pseudomonas resinovorans]
MSIALVVLKAMTLWPTQPDMGCHAVAKGMIQAEEIACGGEFIREADRRSALYSSQGPLRDP